MHRAGSAGAYVLLIPVPSGAHRPELREVLPRMVIATPSCAWLLLWLCAVSVGLQEVDQPGVPVKECISARAPGLVGRSRQEDGGVL